MTPAAKLEELRRVNRKFGLRYEEARDLIDTLEAAIMLIQSASSLIRKSKDNAVETHEKAEVIVLGMKFDAALARLGGGR